MIVAVYAGLARRTIAMKIQLPNSVVHWRGANHKSFRSMQVTGFSAALPTATIGT